MRLLLGDITKMETDAIVNAAASDLMPCPGICSTIYEAADTETLKQLCRQIGHCKIGHAVITPSCGLPSKYIIHVVGAGWYGGNWRERMLIGDCYRHALYKAFGYGCMSVAVPLIFSGDCHIPRAASIRIAIEAMVEFETNHPQMDIRLVLFQKGIYEMACHIFKGKSKTVPEI